MEQLLQEMRIYLNTHYSQEQIKKYGLEDDEDVRRLLIDHKYDTCPPEVTISDYMDQQEMDDVMDLLRSMDE